MSNQKQILLEDDKGLTIPPKRDGGDNMAGSTIPPTRT